MHVWVWLREREEECMYVSDGPGMGFPGGWDG